MTPLHARGRGDAAGDAGGLRFDLRFEAGEGLLRLARPFSLELGSLEELTLSLGRLRFPLDVTGGPQAFRTRRCRVVHARFELDLRSLVRASSTRGITLLLGERSASASRALGIRDDFGVVACEVTPFVDGNDVLLHLDEVRCAVDGPSSPHHRLFAAARLLGATLDEPRGLLRLRRPMRELLGSVLVTQGYRLPDDAELGMSAPRWSDGGLYVESGSVERAAARTAAVGQAASTGLDAEEDARLRAPILASLGHGDVEEALTRLEAARTTLSNRPNLDPGLTRRFERFARAVERERTVGYEAGELRRELADAGDDSVVLSAVVRVALRKGNLQAAAAAAARLCACEPVAELAVQAVLAVVERLRGQEPGAALVLLERAIERVPSSVDLALHQVVLGEAAGDDEAVQRAARRALGSALGVEDRARVAANAARALLRRERAEEAEALFIDALQSSPDSPEALVGLAGIFAARGQRADAIVRLDQAVRGFRGRGDDSGVGDTLRRAAELLRLEGRLSAAEHRLEQAIEHAPNDVELRCELARTRVELGAMEAAAAAYQGLLAGPEHHSRSHALVEAAIFHLNREEAQSARMYVDALARRDRDDPRLTALRQRLTDAGLDSTAAEIPIDRLTAIVGEEPDVHTVATAVGDLAADADAVAVAGADADADAVAVAGAGADSVAGAVAGADSGAGAGAVADAVADEDADTDYAVTNPDAPRRDDAPVIAQVDGDPDDLLAAGRGAEAALVLARRGHADRDAALLRRALSTAETTGDPLTIVAVLDLTLEVVGTGPARASLLARRDKLSSGEQ